MTISNYFDNQVLRIGLIFGLIGGVLMVILGHVDFGLYYLHSYLFIINYLITMIFGLTFYKRSSKIESTYLKRLVTGIIIFTLMTLFSFIDVLIFKKLSTDRTWEDKVLVPLIVMTFGLLLSSLLALFFKPRKK